MNMSIYFNPVSITHTNKQTKKMKVRHFIRILTQCNEVFLVLSQNLIITAEFVLQLYALGTVFCVIGNVLLV